MPNLTRREFFGGIAALAATLSCQRAESNKEYEDRIMRGFYPSIEEVYRFNTDFKRDYKATEIMKIEDGKTTDTNTQYLHQGHDFTIPVDVKIDGTICKYQSFKGDLVDLISETSYPGHAFSLVFMVDNDLSGKIKSFSGYTAMVNIRNGKVLNHNYFGSEDHQLIFIADKYANLEYLTTLNRILYRRDNAEHISANPHLKEGFGFLNQEWNYELAFRHYSGFFDDCIMPQIKKENLIYKK